MGKMKGFVFKVKSILCQFRARLSVVLIALTSTLSNLPTLANTLLPMSPFVSFSFVFGPAEFNKEVRAIMSLELCIGAR